MATDPLDALKLTLMQDVLPLGLAVADRVRRGGPREVLSAFDGSSPDPLGRLRQEGEPAARRVRDGLDRLQPGLGNPVMKVEVKEAASPAPASPPEPLDLDPLRGTDDRAELQDALDRINARLQVLESRLLSGGAPGPAER